MKHALAFITLLFAVSAHAAQWQYETIDAVDGVPLVVAETGNPDGAPLLFIHGYSQSLASWKEQLNDPELQSTYRMVAFDLRGHGASGKPWDADSYTTEDWASDVATVMTDKGLDQPVLIGWSFGGTVMMSYLRHKGMDDISGLIFAAGAMALQPREPMPNPNDENLPPAVRDLMRDMGRMVSPDIATNLAGTSGFVDMLAAVPLSEETMAEALAYNMMLPAYVRAAMGLNQASFEELAGKISVPTALIHGDADALVPFSASETNQTLLPGSELIRYEGIGHAPFLEDPARFNADVAAFAARVFAR